MADIFDFYVYDDRSIQFALAEPIMLEDKDVTQFRFRIPKSLNGFDMTNWEWWFIFVNPRGTKYTTLLELTDDEDEPDEYSVATYTVGYGFSGIIGTVRFSIEALNVSGEEIVNEWHTKTYSTAVIDTLQGLRAVVPEPDGQAASGLTQEEKELILTLFSKAAYADDDAKQSYDQLEALWRVISRLVSFNLSHVTSSNTSASVENGSRYVTTLTADTNYSINSVTVTMGGVDVTATYYNSGTITIPSVTGDIVITATAVLAAQSITATYTQSGTVYDTDTLDSLKSDLVVTATYPDSSTAVIPASDYTLSGTLLAGTSSITVSYGGKTASFNVTVTHDASSLPSGYTKYDYIAMTYSAGETIPGNCGILTDIGMSASDTLETKVLYESSISNAGNILGIRNGQSGTKELGLFITTDSGKIGYWYAGTDTTQNIVAAQRSVVNTIKIQPVGISQTYPAYATINVNGTDYSTGSTATGQTWDSWLGFFKYGISSTQTSTGTNDRYLGFQIGETKITNNNTLLHYLIPCFNGTVYGLYDTVGSKFYSNETYSDKYICGNWE